MDGDTPVTGVLFGSVIVKKRKTGAITFSTKVLVTADWVELGGGFYVLKWSTADMDTLGEFRYWISGGTFDDVTGAFDVIPAPIAIDVAAPKCIVTGNVVDIGGNPMSLEKIVCRPRNVPGVTGTSLIAAGIINTVADAFGNFAVELIRGAIVLVEIERAGIRHLITVPNQPTALILDLLPPIPPTP
jgi:hypothetical protein